jgi:hypothetical protein
MRCYEDKIEYIQDKAEAPPQAKPLGWQTPNSPRKQAK